jgi:ubiquinone/menaquinone biosynthesis C-methylase UbiE
MSFEINYENSPKEEAKKFFDFQMKQHLDSYDLKIDDLRNKEILDVAAGEDLVFPLACNMNDIDDVYSIEPKNIFPPRPEIPSEHEQVNVSQKELEELRKNIPQERLDLALKKHVRAKVENIPFKNETFDLIVSRCAMPVMFFPEEPEIAKKGMDEILRVLKEGGEFRFFPLQEEIFVNNEVPEKYRDMKKHGDEKNRLSIELLDKLQKEKKIKYEIKTVTESDVFYDPERGGFGPFDTGFPVTFIEKVVIITKL